MSKASGKSWLLLLAAAIFALTLPGLMDFVDILGHRIPNLDRANDYMKAILVAVGLTAFLFSIPIPRHDKKNLIMLWGAKATVSLSIMLLYEWNYGLDAYGYFERSQKMFPDFGEIKLGNGTDNLAAALWYLDHSIFPFASYHSQKVFCSFIGLMAIYFFYLGLCRHIKNIAPRTLLYIGFCPSVLFWSSILGKDPINLLGSCIFFFGIFSFLDKFNPLYLVPTAVGVLITALMRDWLVPMLLIPLVIGFVVRIPHKIFRYAMIGVILIGMVLGLQKMSQSILMESQDAISGVNMVSRSWQRGGSATKVPELNSFGAMLAYLPLGMFTALFRPLPGDVLNPFGFMASLENVVLLVLLYLALKRPARGAWYTATAFMLGSFILSWSMVYAFISPQNLGAAVRFRLQVMPMLVFLLLYLPKGVRPRVILNPRERRYSREST